jgi:hypothetical protein
VARWPCSWGSRRGFGARIYSYDLRIFDPTWHQLPRQALAEKIHARFPYLPDSKRLRAARAGRVELPEHVVLVEDFRACIREGSAARVAAPHLDVDRDDDGRADARTVLLLLLAGARRAVRKDEAGYLDLVARVIETGTLSERIRAEMAPFADADDETFTEAARRIYIELIDCLEANEPWARRGLRAPERML